MMLPLVRRAKKGALTVPIVFKFKDNDEGDHQGGLYASTLSKVRSSESATRKYLVGAW
jgi:hypothetical protein